MSKRVSEFQSPQDSRGKSKKPKLTNDANLIPIPVLNVGDDWNIFRASLENYFNSTGINDDARKVSILIALVGQEGYETMLDLCQPILPILMTFKQLCEMMEKHYSYLMFTERVR